LALCNACVLGLLACLDDRMNVAMEQVEEIEQGVTVNKYSDAFIRGNNGNKKFLLKYFTYAF
jgi:small nuclear ribonucleoprotein (snRNP)-like protein